MDLKSEQHCVHVKWAKSRSILDSWNGNQSAEISSKSVSSEDLTTGVTNLKPFKTMTPNVWEHLHQMDDVVTS